MIMRPSYQDIPPPMTMREARAMISFAARDLDMKAGRLVMAQHLTYKWLMLPLSSPETTNNRILGTGSL